MRGAIHTGRLLQELGEIRQVHVDRELWGACAIERLDDEPVRAVTDGESLHLSGVKHSANSA
jgi:hypothetical protein